MLQYIWATSQQNLNIEIYTIQMLQYTWATSQQNLNIEDD